ncbi:hypothetical protein ACFPJ1_40615 [Kribbella qitaiheensis]|uniref:hypothetical protein n=1 Tax=Kribbella qitaiheensis TaxID=1544730 RepID=UPI0036068E96
MSDDRPVHASFKTKGLPREWEAAGDGRWMHVGHGHPFADTIEQVTCSRCLYYIEHDAKFAGALP